VINETFQRLKTDLERREENLLGALEALHLQQRKYLEDQKNSFEWARESLNMSKMYGEALVSGGTSSQIADSKHLVVARIVTLVNNIVQDPLFRFQIY